MIDHVTLRVKDIEKTLTFYSAALKPLAYSLLFDKTFGEVRVLGFGKGKKLDTWFTTDRPVSGPTHICWKADSKEQVDKFYKAALAAGGKDNGAPGFRPEYHEKYYGTFVLDPDGNNAEAVFD
jgi:catechol 2,3-dioxygenase-like lactoylglutathione lyase family enzyme